MAVLLLLRRAVSSYVCFFAVVNILCNSCVIMWVCSDKGRGGQITGAQGKVGRGCTEQWTLCPQVCQGESVVQREGESIYTLATHGSCSLTQCPNRALETMTRSRWPSERVSSLSSPPASRDTELWPLAHPSLS